MKMMEKFVPREKHRYVTPELSETAQNELDLMKQINHDNIIRYFDNFDEECYSTDYLCIICEYCQVPLSHVYIELILSYKILLKKRIVT